MLLNTIFLSNTLSAVHSVIGGYTATPSHTYFSLQTSIIELLKISEILKVTPIMIKVTEIEILTKQYTA